MARRYRGYAMLLGAAMLATLAGSVYYLYREHSFWSISAVLGSTRELKAPGAPDQTPIGEIGDVVRRLGLQRSVAGVVGAVPVAASLAPAPAAAAIAVNTQAPAAPAPSTAVERNTAAIEAPAASPRSPVPQRANAPARVGTPEAAAAVAAATRPKPAEARSEQRRQGFGPCTDEIAALGLCTRELTSQRP